MPTRFARNCRDVTRLVLEGEDRNLAWWERVLVRAHMSICDACPKLQAQVGLMRQAFGRWRSYADEEPGGP